MGGVGTCRQRGAAVVQLTNGSTVVARIDKVPGRRSSGDVCQYVSLCHPNGVKCRNALNSNLAANALELSSQPSESGMCASMCESQ
jgi:hypothetical protein